MPQQQWITTGTLARELGVSRETIWADLERLGIDPVRDSTGRRLLSPAEADRIRRRHAGNSEGHPSGAPVRRTS